MIPVWWVTLHEGILARGYADQSIVEDVLSGELWRPPGYRYALEHFEGGPYALPPDRTGAIVVIPGRWHASTEDVTTIRTRLDRLSWALIIVTGDEESIFPFANLRGGRRRIWIQTPHPQLSVGADRFFGDGYRPETRRIIGGRPCPEKTRPWFYAAQNNNPDRRDLAALLSHRVDRTADALTTTVGFMQGLPYEEYVDGMLSAKAAPCPAGNFTPDTFRLFEALETGCVPIVPATAPGGPRGYWPTLFGPVPFPIIQRWADLPGILDGAALSSATAAETGGWWVAWKRSFAAALVEDLDFVGAPLEPADGPDDLITVLVPTSPIPSHPDTGIVDETIRSIRDRLPTAEIIVLVDGIRPEQEDRRASYDEYRRRLVWNSLHRYGGNVLPLFHGEHLHQATMTRRALETTVRTPLILFVEHDTPLVGEIPFDRLADAVLCDEPDVIRLHHEASILEPHRHLMLDRTPVDVCGVPLLRTVQWSQRPHLASADFYRRILDEFFSDSSRTMIEDVLHGVVDTHYRELGRPGWEKFRLWMFAPGGDMKRSTHLDGREGDPKYEMTWAYDGGTVPLGAPNPARDEPRIAVRENGNRLGIFGARADRRGLAIQTTELARHLEPAAVFGIVESGSPYPADWSDYDPARLTIATVEQIRADPRIVRDWLRNVDVVLGAETFYVDFFTGLARQQDVRTVLVANFEFTGHVLADDWKPLPDLLCLPSPWNADRLPVPATILPHGVDRNRLPFRQRTEARTFLHVVGHMAANDRNGTRIVRDALQHVRSEIRVVFRSQRGIGTIQTRRNVTVETIVGDVPDYWSLYDDGDVLLLPRRYGGQSLVLNEALSTGMPVLMPDVDPQNGFLPPGMRLRTSGRQGWRRQSGPDLYLHNVDPRVLAQRIDELAERRDEVAALSTEADRIAEKVAWPNLLPVYRRLLGLGALAYD